ncbi:HDOD domain-containing protein [Glaciecola sp. MH2013]|uniref:EAL and HDOD domain-containing protein n=1 Tax=Glaciecola sp. MH2013 TaxID=2785524 RepID=UPI00189EC3B0|nr:HDOD domain-containing protein [Glaciecola sp. MH2013]MBF7073840.1 HDOD domain-containing protein [Glaciecola sp. MH2013]
MFAFIAREPILDKEQELFAYELLFRDGENDAFPSHPAKKTELIKQRFNTLGIDDIAGEQNVFIHFLPETLINHFPEELSADNVVIELTQNPSMDSGLMKACEELKSKGFKLALSGDNLESTILTSYPYIDILKVDLSKAPTNMLEKHVPALAASGIQLVAEKVSSLEQFAMCRDLGFDYFQGYFFTQPEAKSVKELPASKLTLVELLSQSARPDFDLETVAAIIERDAALAYLLLRFINNPMVNKRLKITSLRHALKYLGEVEVKKFIALLSLASLNENKPLELLQVSLVRAKFCELCAAAKYGKEKAMSAFVIGLFSLLDAILDSDMTTVVEKLPTSVEIKQTLLGFDSEYRNILDTAKGFESGLWSVVIENSESMAISQQDLHSFFNDAMRWGNEMRLALSDFFPKAKPSL